VLYQLSYSPKGCDDECSLAAEYALVVHRRALGLLFTALAAGLLGIAAFSALAGGRAWVLALAAAALGVWMGGLAARALRPSRMRNR
jgi:hypothetical protein